MDRENFEFGSVSKHHHHLSLDQELNHIMGHRNYDYDDDEEMLFGTVEESVQKPPTNPAMTNEQSTTQEEENALEVDDEYVCISIESEMAKLKIDEVNPDGAQKGLRGKRVDEVLFIENSS